MNNSMVAAVMMGCMMISSVSLAKEEKASSTACKPSLEQRDNLRFEGLDWSGMSFARMNLAEREFVFMSMDDADFAHAGLQGAIFSGARMTDGKFFGVRAPTANFSHACLKGADFRKADLRDADFTGASLRGARLWVPSSMELFGKTLSVLTAATAMRTAVPAKVTYASLAADGLNPLRATRSLR